MNFIFSQKIYSERDKNDNVVEIHTEAFKDYRFVEHIQIYSDDINAMNTY